MGLKDSVDYLIDHHTNYLLYTCGRHVVMKNVEKNDINFVQVCSCKALLLTRIVGG